MAASRNQATVANAPAGLEAPDDAVSIFEPGAPDFAARLAAAEGGGPTREAIIREALKLFAENGYRGTSLRDLAKAIGMKAGSLYNHLSSKQELLSDMVLFGVVELLQGVSGLLASVPETDPVDRLRVGVRAHVLFFCLHRDQVRVLGREHDLLTGAQKRENYAIRDEYEQLFQRIVDNGIERGVFRQHDAAVTVKAIIGLGEQAAGWFRADGRLSAAEVADIYADLAVRALIEPVVYAEVYGPPPKRQRSTK